MQNLKYAKYLKNNKLLQQFFHSPFNHAFQLPQERKKETLYDEDILSDHQYEKINFNNLKQREYSNIVYFDKQKQREDLKDFTKYPVSKAKPKCGVEDFYQNGKPQLPDIKKMQDGIGEFIQELAKENPDMENKFVGKMDDKHYDIFHEISYSPAVALNIINFKFQPPTKEQTKELFDADSKNGNIMFAICDAKEKKVSGCFGVRFHTAQMPSKEGGYTEMIVPEIWAKMSEPQKGMSALLRRLQEQLYENGFTVIFARIPCNNNITWQPHSQEIFKMIPSFKVPSGGIVDIQTYYGYRDKNEKDITKDEHYFLRTLTTQLANKGLTAQKALPSLDEGKKQRNDFGRSIF
jgi:hypothetical protein